MSKSNPFEILLVDDSDEDANLAIRSLKKNNLANDIHRAEDGEEALEYLFAEGRYTERKGNPHPKVVLLDLKMPKVNGLEVLKRMKKDEGTKDIPVVVLTSSAEDSDIQECYKLGVNSYIVKPVEFEKFVKVISDLGFYWLALNQPPKT